MTHHADDEGSPRNVPAPVDRRRLVWGGLAAAVGTAVAGGLSDPAAAANGSPVLLGRTNGASATTIVATTAGSGLLGRSSASGGAGVRGEASAGYGAVALTSAAGYAAVLGRNTSTSTKGGFGVRGITTHGEGVRGESADTEGKGVAGRNTANSGGIGVYGLAAGSGGYGVEGDNTSAAGTGVYGKGNTGVRAESTGGTGGTGLYAVGDNGVYSTGRIAILAQSTSKDGLGLYARIPSGGSGYALITEGNARIAGDLTVTGALSKGGGSFKIDHPLDPANKYLYHSFVESPDMKNIYDGVVNLDSDGTATVELPDWFEALNSDYRYQLTPIGGAAPSLHVSAEINHRTFSIAGGPPGLKVSWQVTGIRQDDWANANRIPIEEDKTSAERGRYLHPDAIKGAKAHALP